MGVFTLLNPSLCIRIAPSVYKKSTLDTPPPSIIKDLVSLQSDFQSHVEIVRSLGDSKAEAQWKDEFLHDFGIGLGNVVAILDPDVIILGGIQRGFFVH